MAVEAGTRVGRFVIHEYLGQGDLGVLFRARGPNAGSVGIKVLRSLSGAKERARFLVLARRLSGVRHPNLVSVFDFGECDDAPYLVLQLVAGSSLAELLRTSSISQPAALWVLRGIAAGVDHAHQSGLLHGALKPQQILLDGDDHPLVTDFGLTPLRWPRPDGVSVVVPERNAAYAAPELVAGGQPTAAADRYAFASMAYELLTGRSPFEGEPYDVMNAQLDVRPPEPSALNPALTSGLDAVLMRGLSKDPRARWRSCTEMVVALSEAVSLARPPAVARPTAVRTQPARRPRSESAADAGDRSGHWSLLATGALGGVALVAASLVAGGLVAWMATEPPAVAIGLSDTTVRAGQRIVVTATNVPAGQTGVVELHSGAEQIGTFRASGRGVVHAQVVVPRDAAPGEHEVILCWASACHGSARITVEGEPVDVSSGAEPQPGTPPGTLPEPMPQEDTAPPDPNPAPPADTMLPPTYSAMVRPALPRAPVLAGRAAAPAPTPTPSSPSPPPELATNSRSGRKRAAGRDGPDGGSERPAGHGHSRRSR